MNTEKEPKSVSPKQQMIEEIGTLLSQKAKELHDNEDIPIETKLVQVDVLWDVNKFLQEYDKNVQILNEYKRTHRYTRAQMDRIEKEDMGYDAR